MVDSGNHVGPVLQAGVAADAVVAAIRELNEGVQVTHRGSYLRVLVPGRCTVTRRAIEAHRGQPFRLPGDLEQIMPSFRGRLALSEDEASWHAPPAGGGPAAR
ncbi:MAG TPA: MmoB/DmpM family protein [Polyangiaceae bacterium]|nr:MmoB/DmpM family protein [Polyangiaceae bacterium]